MGGAWLNKGKYRENTLCGKALVRVRAKIENNRLFGYALVRIMANIEKNTLFGRALVRIRVKKIEKTDFLVTLWLELWQT